MVPIVQPRPQPPCDPALFTALATRLTAAADAYDAVLPTTAEEVARVFAAADALSRSSSWLACSQWGRTQPILTTTGPGALSSEVTPLPLSHSPTYLRCACVYCVVLCVRLQLITHSPLCAAAQAVNTTACLAAPFTVEYNTDPCCNRSYVRPHSPSLLTPPSLLLCLSHLNLLCLTVAPQARVCAVLRAAPRHSHRRYRRRQRNVLAHPVQHAGLLAERGGGPAPRRRQPLRHLRRGLHLCARPALRRLT